VTLQVRHADGSATDVHVTLRSKAELDANSRLGPLGIGKGAVTDATTGAVIEPGIPVEIRVLASKVNYPVGTALKLGVDRTVDATQLIIAGVGDILGNFVTRPTEAPTAIGPVGIAIEIGNVFWTLGPIATLYLAGLLSANLAVVNILPLPPLDGGRVVVILLKRFAGRRVSLRAEQLTYLVGYALLFAFLIWVTTFDLLRQLGGTP